MVKNPPCNARDTGLIPGPGESHMPQGNWACVSQLLSTCSGAHKLQLLSTWATTTKSPHALVPVLCNKRKGFPGGSDCKKKSAFNVGDPGSIPGIGRSAGEGNGNPLQYSCMENSMDRGAWQAAVHGIAKQWEAPAPQQDSRPPSPQLEKACMQQWRGSTDKNTYFFLKKEKGTFVCHQNNYSCYFIISWDFLVY